MKTKNPRSRQFWCIERQPAWQSLWRLLSCLFMLGIYSPSLQAADDCIRTILPDPRADKSLQYRQRDQRCEGLIVKEVSAAFKIVAFTHLPNTFDLQGSSVHIGIPQQLNQSVRITALSLPIKTFFRMDKHMIPPQSDFLWSLEGPISQVRYGQLPLHSFHIALRGRYFLESGEEVHVPLRIGKDSASVIPNTFELALLAEVHVQSPLLLTLFQVDSTLAPVNTVQTWQALEDEDIFEGKTIYLPITLPRDIQNETTAPHLFKLQINSQTRRGFGVSVPLYFENKGY